MADKKNKSEDQENSETVRIKTQPITVHAQYIMDLSFENAFAQNALTNLDGEEPSARIQVDVDARMVKENKDSNSYEVLLRMNIVSEVGDRPVFIVQLDYGALISISNAVPRNMVNAILFIEIPHLLFPSSRQIISSLTVDSGYPPLVLSPIDFQSLYIDRYKDGLDELDKEQSEQSDVVGNA